MELVTLVVLALVALLAACAGPAGSRGPVGYSERQLHDRPVDVALPPAWIPGVAEPVPRARRRCALPASHY